MGNIRLAGVITALAALVDIWFWMVELFMNVPNDKSSSWFRKLLHWALNKWHF